MVDPLTPPAIRLTRIAEIRTVELMDDDLERMDAVYADETQALGFAGPAFGVFATVGVSWLAAGHLSATALAVHASMLALFGALTLWFGATWLRARRQRPRLIDGIRHRQHLRAVR